MSSDILIDSPIERWSIDKLIPYDKNAKVHSPEKVSALARSISTFRWHKAKAIEVTPDGLIINGHCRRLAAIHLGMKEVPVAVRHDIKTEAEIKAYRLSDNKVAEGTYDNDLMKDELGELHGEFFDMTDFGWTDKDIDFTQDLGEIDLDVMTDDIALDVQLHADSTTQKIEDEDGKEFPISKVLGFSKVTARQQRVIKALMAHARQVTGRDGAEALCEISTDYLGIK